MTCRKEYQITDGEYAGGALFSRESKKKGVHSAEERLLTFTDDIHRAPSQILSF